VRISPSLASAPPGFARDPARSYGDPSSADAVVHAENLDAMQRLAGAGFAGRFRCVYLDPPFNSGRRFALYDDALDPGAWRAMMLERLAAARHLMSDDGAIFVEIDDTELGSLQCAMDDVFGRGQRISTITIVRSAATGHKAGNRGPVNVTDYLFVYAKDRARFRYNPVVRERTRYDAAYSTWLENPADPAEAWRFCPLRAHVMGELGRAPSLAEVHAYAVAYAQQVVRFAQPRYEAVSREAQALIDRDENPVACCGSLGRAARTFCSAAATASCGSPTR
jgi:adenine-specific DNA-methyltransferase